MKKGLKKKIVLVFKNIFSSLLTNLPEICLPYFFSLIFFKLNTNVEVRKIIYRKKVHFIPFPVKKHRKVFLIFKWLNHSLLTNHSKIKFSKKLYNELFLIVFNEPLSNVCKLKNLNALQAYQYKSKAHYRWS